MSLEEITEACNKPETTLDQVVDLFNTMFQNAQTFNPEGSWVYNDAEQLRIVMNKEWAKVEDIYKGVI